MTDKQLSKAIEKCETIEQLESLRKEVTDINRKGITTTGWVTVTNLYIAQKNKILKL